MKEKNQKIVIIQLFLIFLLLNSIYYLSTKFSVLPYGDSYWEYAVLKTFEHDSSLFIISTSSSITSNLSMYSGWPLLQSLAIVFSGVTGINTFQTLIIIPVIIGVMTFIILYIFLDRLRIKLNFGKELVSFGLLFYVISPDSIFWRTQFVRQNLGALLLSSLFLVTYLLLSFSSQKRKIVLLAIMIVVSIIIAHHLTSFVTLSYFFLLFMLLFIQDNFQKKNILERIKSMNFQSIHLFLVLGLLTLIAIYVYWDNVVGPLIYPIVKSRIDRFLDILTGIRSPDFFVPQAVYPNQLTPLWALLLLAFRDIAIYASAVIGFIFLWRKRPQSMSRLFVILSIVAFALLFIINNLTIRLEPYRLLMMSLPFIVFLSGIIFFELKSHKPWNKLLYVILVLIIFSSFVGLWGHNFAPIHLYDSSINPQSVGENVSPTPILDFVNTSINFKKLDWLWTDNVDALILILPTTQYQKIRTISPSSIDKLGTLGNEAYFEFSDSYLYKYYAGIYSPIRTPEESEAFRTVIKNKLNSVLNLAYDDGTFRIWLTN